MNKHYTTDGAFNLDCTTPAIKALSLLALECHLNDDAWCREHRAIVIKRIDGNSISLQTYVHFDDSCPTLSDCGWVGEALYMIEGVTVHTFDMTKPEDQEHLRQVIQSRDAFYMFANCECKFLSP